ncbi:CCHC-type domain-containing protein [Trichonephila clavipes]|nr:CCHC-type domain-containing protein [Trichonephila clavipes]
MKSVRGSLVVNVTDTWLACHEFGPSTSEDPPCGEAMFASPDLSDQIRRIVKEEIEKVLPRIETCINDGPSDLEYIIREEVRSNLTSVTREKPAPSPYRTKRTGESSWGLRPRPRQENRPT